MTKRNTIGFIYFGIVIVTLLLRVASALDIYSALGIDDTDAFYSCVVQILIFGVMTVSLYFLTVGRREGARAFIVDFGIKKLSVRNCIRTVVLAICMIIVSSGVSYIWQLILMLMGYTHVSSPTDYSNIGMLLRELALTAMLPAIFEEISHRGLINAGYRECGWKYVLISALYFSLMHQNIVQTGYTFFAGAAMALAFYYTGSIFPGIFMHFLNNTVSVVSGYTNQNGGLFAFANVVEKWLYGTPAGLAVGFVIVIVCAGIMVWMFARMRKDAVRHGIISPIPFEPQVGVTPLKKDAMFIAIVAVGVVAAIFSFAWGIMR